MNANEFVSHMEKCWESPTYVNETAYGLEVDNDISTFDEAEKLGLTKIGKAWHCGVRGELWSTPAGDTVWLCFDGAGLTADMNKVVRAIK